MAYAVTNYNGGHLVEKMHVAIGHLLAADTGHVLSVCGDNAPQHTSGQVYKKNKKEHNLEQLQKRSVNVLE